MFESLFRSMQYALMGNASSEFLFLCDFFMTSGQEADELFHLVFGKSLKILMVYFPEFRTYFSFEI